MAEITSTGIKIDSFNDLFDAISAEYKNIYGQDILIEQSTADGQKLSIFVKAYRDLQELGVSVYNSFDPDTAIGTQLNKLMKLCGISRIPATKSVVDIQITTSQNVTLDSDYTLKDTLGQLWVISEATTLTTGTTTVSFIADEWGAIEALPNTITDFESIVLGVTSVTNPNSATVGRNEETDNELKLRRKKSVSLPSNNTVDGLLAKLLNVNSVLDAVIYENDTDTYDADLELNAHTIWCIVDGGLNDDIIETIAIDKMAGTGLKGSVTDVYTAQILRQDGTYRNKLIEVLYDRPIEVDIYIKFDVKAKNPSDTLDLEAMKQALETKTFFIGENATVTELYAYIYSANTNFIATNLQLSIDDITYVTDELEAGYQDKFMITSTNITITEL